MALILAVRSSSVSSGEFTLTITPGKLNVLCSYTAVTLFPNVQDFTDGGNNFRGVALPG